MHNHVNTHVRIDSHHGEIRGTSYPLMQNTSYQRRRHLGSTSASLERGATQQRVEAENFLWTSTREGDKDTGQIWRRAVGILIVAIP